MVVDDDDDLEAEEFKRHLVCVIGKQITKGMNKGVKSAHAHMTRMEDKTATLLVNQKDLGFKLAQSNRAHQISV